MSEEKSKLGIEEKMKLAETELKKHGFTTNDLVMIPGRRRVRVNGIELKLGDHAFTLLLLLAERTFAAPGEYLATDAVILEIERSKSRLGALELSWVVPTEESVYKAICELRAALKKARLNQTLVELMRGQGYRLNTPAENIWIAPALGFARIAGHDPGMLGDYWLGRKDFHGKFGFMGKPLK